MEIKNKDVKVSVIIPAYNAEKYIEDALNSVLKSKYKNIEVIVINDGSTDRTADILNEYSEKESRLLIINEKNAGVSKARNKGIRRARGNFIFFLDADDTINPVAFDKAIENLNLNNIDIWMFPYNITDEQLKVIRKVVPYSCEKTITVNEFKKVVMCSSFMNFCWGKFYRTEFIHNNKLEFKVEMKIGEDVDFQLQMMKQKPHMFYADLTIVNYRQQKNSVIHRFDESYFYNLEENYKTKKRLAEEINAKKQDYDIMYKELGVILLSYLRKMCRNKNNTYEIEKIMNSEIMKEIVSNMSLDNLRIGQKVCAKLLKLKRYKALLVLLKIS